MASDISAGFLEKLRKHYETGVALKHMNLTEDQRRRVEVCSDAFKRFSSDPFLNLNQYLRNRWDRSFSEIRNDIKVINYMASFYAEGERQLSAMRVRHTATAAMRAGLDSGNYKDALTGAKLLLDLDDLAHLHDGEADENKINMPIVITTDASKRYKNKKNYDEDAMRRIRAKYGAKEDPWQEMVQNKAGEYVAIETPEGQEAPSGYPEEEEAMEMEEPTADDWEGERPVYRTDRDGDRELLTDRPDWNADEEEEE